MRIGSAVFGLRCSQNMSDRSSADFQGIFESVLSQKVTGGIVDQRAAQSSEFQKQKNITYKGSKPAISLEKASKGHSRKQSIPDTFQNLKKWLNAASSIKKRFKITLPSLRRNGEA